MDERIRSLLMRSKMGDLTDRERNELQQALLGLAPSSPEYRQIVDAVGTSPKQGPSFPNPFDIFMGGRGVPTADFLSPLGSPLDAAKGQVTPDQVLPGIITGPMDFNPRTGGSRPSPAEAERTQGEGPIGGGVEVSERDRTWKEALAQSKLQDSQTREQFYDPEQDTQSFPNDPSAMKNQPLLGNPDAAMEDFGYSLPEGYTFTEGGPMAVQQWSRNPNAYLTNYAEEKGGGANMAAFLANPYKSALAMARMGMLGGGYGDDLFAGQGMGDASQLARTEDFLNQYSGSGQFVDPKKIMQQALSRGASTDFEGMINPQTNLPYAPEDIINITNAAISASAAFMGPEGEEWLNSILAGKASEYINAIANGELDANTSYPKWLQGEGIGEIL